MQQIGFTTICHKLELLCPLVFLALRSYLCMYYTSFPSDILVYIIYTFDYRLLADRGRGGVSIELFRKFCHIYKNFNSKMLKLLQKSF